jgi:hypothetical protein
LLVITTDLKSSGLRRDLSDDSRRHRADAVHRHGPRRTPRTALGWVAAERIESNRRVMGRTIVQDDPEPVRSESRLWATME